MAKNNTLELALRIKADAAAAKAELGRLKTSINDVEAATAEADIATRKATQADKTHTQTQQQSTRQQQLSAEAARQMAAAQTRAMQAATQARAATAAKTRAEELAVAAAAKVSAASRAEEKAFNQAVGAIDKTERALARLDRAEAALTRRLQQGKIAADDYARYLARIAQQRNALSGIAGDAGQANTALASLAGTARTLRTVLAAAVAGAGITGLVRGVVDTNLAWQQAVFTMQAATATSADAGKQLEFVRDISQRLGLELISTGNAYAQLMASAKNEPELAASLQRVFEGVAMAGTALHKTPADMQGILLALEQMVSKGKVQTQELVLQLGQRVPGAFHLAADALGTNTEQLSKWLEQGLIPANEFLPRFGDALIKAYGPASQQAADGLQAKLNRLTNAYTNLQTTAGEAGFIDAYAEAVTELTGVLNDPAVAQGFTAFIGGLGQVVKWSAKAAAFVANVTSFVAEEFAARSIGPALDDAARLDQELTRLNRRLELIQPKLDAALKAGDSAREAELLRFVEDIQQKIAVYRQVLDDLEGGSATVAGAVGKPAASNVDAGNKDDFKPGGGNSKDKSLEFVQQLEQEAATIGKTREELRMYAIANAHLTGELLRRAQAASLLITRAEKQAEADKKAAVDAAAAKRQAAQDAKDLQQLQQQYWRAMGDDASAAAAEIKDKFAELRQRLQAEGNAEGVALIDKVIDLKKAETDLEVIEKKLAAALAEQQRLEQSIQTQRDAGNMSNYDAQTKIVELHRSTNAELQKQRPLLAELAMRRDEVGTQATAMLRQLDAEAERLRATLTTLQATLQAGLTEGFTQALTGLAQGTMNLRQAVAALGQAVLDALTRMAAEALAQKAVAGLFNDDDTAAAALSVASVELGASGSVLLSAASALSLSAAELAAAGTGQAVASVAAVGASTGGHITGAGTSTSDSIPARLSNNEFVTRAASVMQPGALDFLHDFNARGMAALADWAPVHHFTGGLAGYPAPALPAPGGVGDIAAVGAGTGNIEQRLHFNLIDDPRRIAEALNTPAGHEAITVMLSRDPAKFRQILGV